MVFLLRPFCCLGGRGAAEDAMEENRRNGIRE